MNISTNSVIWKLLYKLEVAWVGFKVTFEQNSPVTLLTELLPTKG